LKITNGDDIYEHYKYLEKEGEENFRLGFINKNNILTKDVLVAMGAEDEVSISKSKIARFILDYGDGCKIVMVHNHPHKKSYPSDEDDKLTETVAEICELLGRQFMDHVIIAKDEFFSYKAQSRTKHVNRNKKC